MTDMVWFCDGRLEDLANGGRGREGREDLCNGAHRALLLSPAGCQRLEASQGRATVGKDEREERSGDVRRRRFERTVRLHAPLGAVWRVKRGEREPKRARGACTASCRCRLRNIALTPLGARKRGARGSPRATVTLAGLPGTSARLDASTFRLIAQRLHQSLRCLLSEAPTKCTETGPALAQPRRLAFVAQLCFDRTAA